MRRAPSLATLALASTLHALTVFVLLAWAIGAVHVPVVLFALYAGVNDYADTRRIRALTIQLPPHL